VISEKLTQIIIPDQSIAQPYQPNTQIPTVCNIDKTCSSLLLEMDNKEKHLWVPTNGPMHYFKLIDNGSDVVYGPNLHGNDCFKFFHIGNRYFGALCIGRVLDENLIVPYKIEYKENGELQDNKLGIEIHLNIEDHSPFIVLNSTGMPEIVGIGYFEHLSAYKLFIIHYGSESHDIIDVPSDCMGRHDLQPVGQSDAIIRCINGKLLYFNGEHSTFSILPHSNIEIVSTCPNTASYVLVQGTGDIIFNKSGKIYQLSVNTNGQPLQIASAVCYATNEDEITYYFADVASGTIYELNLGDVVAGSSRHTLVPQIVRRSNTHDGSKISLYIDGPILWGKLTLSNHSDVTVYLIDLLTKKQSLPVTVNGPNVFVQLYAAEICEDTTITTNIPKQEQNSNNQNTADMLKFILPVAGVIIIIIIIVFLVLVYRRRRNRSQSCGM